MCVCMYICIYMYICIIMHFTYLPIFVRFMVILLLLPDVASNTSPKATAKFSVFLNKPSATGNCIYS